MRTLYVLSSIWTQSARTTTFTMFLLVTMNNASNNQIIGAIWLPEKLLVTYWTVTIEFLPRYELVPRKRSLFCRWPTWSRRCYQNWSNTLFCLTGSINSRVSRSSETFDELLSVYSSMTKFFFSETKMVNLGQVFPNPSLKTTEG